MREAFCAEESGAIVPVALVEGEPSSDDAFDPPVAVRNVGKFVLFVMGHPIGTDVGLCGTIVLRKSDGALFCSKEKLDFSDLKAAPSGDLFYGISRIIPHPLVRLDFSNPVSLVTTVLLDFSDGNLYNGFTVNRDGDVMLGLNGPGSVDTRVYKRAGGYTIVKPFTLSLFMFTGLGEDNSNFYLITPSPSTGNGDPLPANLWDSIFRISLTSAGDATYTTYANPGSMYSTTALSLSMPNFGMSQASTADRHFILFKPDGNIISEVYNAAGTTQTHQIAGFSAINALYGCNTQLIVRGRSSDGNDTIARLDPVTTGTEVVIDSRLYSITTVVVSETCEISFGGRRLSDNARILGNIPADSKTVTVYTNALDSDVKQLVRIN